MTTINLDQQLHQHADVIEKIITTCQRLHARNMLSAADGNISYRVNNNFILITPSGIAKAFMTAKDIAIINIEGEILHGKPSTERWMHLEIFKTCEKAKTVIHAHPTTAIAWSIARPDISKLPSDCLSEVILATGDIPFADYARPGTSAMGEVLKPFLPKHRALILRRHGAVTWGEDLDEAYRGMERIENSAQILAEAVKLGGLHPLPPDEVQYLYELRKKIGDILL